MPPRGSPSRSVCLRRRLARSETRPAWGRDGAAGGAAKQGRAAGRGELGTLRTLGLNPSSPVSTSLPMKDFPLWASFLKLENGADEDAAFPVDTAASSPWLSREKANSDLNHVAGSGLRQVGKSGHCSCYLSPLPSLSPDTAARTAITCHPPLISPQSAPLTWGLSPSIPAEPLIRSPFLCAVHFLLLEKSYSQRAKTFPKMYLSPHLCPHRTSEWQPSCVWVHLAYELLFPPGAQRHTAVSTK